MPTTFYLVVAKTAVINTYGDENGAPPRPNGPENRLK